MNDLKWLWNDIPGEFIKQREGSWNSKTRSRNVLDYIDVFYVYDVLNEKFGPASWTVKCEIKDIIKTERIKKYKDGSGQFVEKLIKEVTYLAECVLTINHHDSVISKQGWGSCTHEASGEGYETAFKGAHSDAVKRAAAQVGRALGLSLYKPREGLRYRKTIEETNSMEELSKVWDSITEACRDKKITQDNMKALGEIKNIAKERIYIKEMKEAQAMQKLVETWKMVYKDFENTGISKSTYDILEQVKNDAKVRLENHSGAVNGNQSSYSMEGSV